MSIKIVEVIVGAGTGFNNPFESFSNFKPSVTLKAVIDPTAMTVEEFDAYVKDLQEKAHTLVKAERERILADLERDRDIDIAEGEVNRWKSVVESYENILTTYPAIIETLEGESWERSDKEGSLRGAKNNIEPAKSSLVEAKAELARLNSR
jgi:hypothetical protein